MSLKSCEGLTRDGFYLTYCIEGHGIATFVIGSSIYYPRIFSKDLRNVLNLIFMDHRGFVSDNKEVKPEDFTIDALIDDFEALRKKLRLDKILVIGHSIHAFMALEYAKRYSQYVSGLILIASSPYPNFAAADQYFAEFASLERKEKLAANLKHLEAHLNPSPDQVFVQRMLAFAPMIWYDWNFDATSLWKDVALNPVGSNIVWGNLFANYDIRKTLQLIHCPIFLALGRCDFWNPPYLWDGYQNEFKNMTLRFFEKSGHTPSLEEPILFDAEVEAWLRSQGFLSIKVKENS